MANQYVQRHCFEYWSNYSYPGMRIVELRLDVLQQMCPRCKQSLLEQLHRQRPWVSLKPRSYMDPILVFRMTGDVSFQLE